MFAVLLWQATAASAPLPYHWLIVAIVMIVSGLFSLRKQWIESRRGPKVESLARSLHDLPNVSSVSVHQEHGVIHATVVMSRFDRDARMRVYAAEAALCDEFPHALIEVHLIDASASVDEFATER